MTFKRVVAEAGFTKTELAQLYGVSRQTIHAWIAVGPPREGSYTARMATVITEALLGAVATKILPLGAMERGKRQARIARMAAKLQSLHPGPAATKK